MDSKKVILLCLGFVLFISMSLAGTWKGEGIGTQSSPYTIDSCSNLDNLLSLENSDLMNAYYELASDIDCFNTSISPIGGSSNPFNGNFDGNGYAIVGLNISKPYEENVGLFGYIGSSGVVKNLHVTDSTVIGGNNVGGIAGFLASGGRLINCSFESGNVSGIIHGVEVNVSKNDTIDEIPSVEISVTYLSNKQLCENQNSKDYKVYKYDGSSKSCLKCDDGIFDKDGICRINNSEACIANGGTWQIDDVCYDRSSNFDGVKYENGVWSYDNADLCVGDGFVWIDNECYDGANYYGIMTERTCRESNKYYTTIWQQDGKCWSQIGSVAEVEFSYMDGLPSFSKSGTCNDNLDCSSKETCINGICGTVLGKTCTTSSDCGESQFCNTPQDQNQAFCVKYNASLLSTEDACLIKNYNNYNIYRYDVFSDKCFQCHNGERDSSGICRYNNSEDCIANGHQWQVDGECYLIGEDFSELYYNTTSNSWQLNEKGCSNKNFDWKEDACYYFSESTCDGVYFSSGQCFEKGSDDYIAFYENEYTIEDYIEEFGGCVDSEGWHHSDGNCGEPVVIDDSSYDDDYEEVSSSTDNNGVTTIVSKNYASGYEACMGDEECLKHYEQGGTIEVIAPVLLPLIPFVSASQLDVPDVSGNNIGGLVGKSHGIIDSCFVSDTYIQPILTNSEYFGGLVGYVVSSTITNSYVRNSNVGISGSKKNGKGTTYVGGFAGYVENGEITNCYSALNTINGRTYVGGFIGVNSAVIKNSFTKENVLNIAGLNYDSSVEGCFTSWNKNNNLDLVYSQSICGTEYKEECDYNSCRAWGKSCKCGSFWCARQKPKCWDSSLSINAFTNLNSNVNGITDIGSTKVTGTGISRSGLFKEWDLGGVWKLVDSDYPKLTWSENNKNSTIYSLRKKICEGKYQCGRIEEYGINCGTCSSNLYTCENNRCTSSNIIDIKTNIIQPRINCVSELNPILKYGIYDSKLLKNISFTKGTLNKNLDMSNLIYSVSFDSSNDMRSGVFGEYGDNNNGIWNENGIYGGALKFVANNKSNFNTKVKNFVDNSFSFGGWIKTNEEHEIDGNSLDGTLGVAGQKYAVWPDHHGDTGAGLGLSVGTNGISVYGHGTNYMPALLTYNADIGNDWNHIMVVCDSNKIMLYLNGHNVKNSSKISKTLYSPTIIGGGSYGYFNGFIDEFKIFNESLDSSEIEFLYESNVRPGNINTNDYWEFETRLADSEKYEYKLDVCSLAGSCISSGKQSIMVGNCDVNVLINEISSIEENMWKYNITNIGKVDVTDLTLNVNTDEFQLIIEPSNFINNESRTIEDSIILEKGQSQNITVMFNPKDDTILDMVPTLMDDGRIYLSKNVELTFGFNNQNNYETKQITLKYYLSCNESNKDTIYTLNGDKYTCICNKFCKEGEYCPCVTSPKIGELYKIINGIASVVFNVTRF